MADQGKLANLLKVYGLEEHEAPDSDQDWKQRYRSELN